jgi:hypothetical protein
VKTSFSLPSFLDNKILSGAFYDHYDQPSGFCWDVSCLSNNPIIDDPDLNGYNVKQMTTDFTQVVLDRVSNWLRKSN